LKPYTCTGQHPQVLRVGRPGPVYLLHPEIQTKEDSNKYLYQSPNLIEEYLKYISMSDFDVFIVKLMQAIFIIKVNKKKHCVIQLLSKKLE
jgi:hypothetical protein